MDAATADDGAGPRSERVNGSHVAEKASADVVKVAVLDDVVSAAAAGRSPTSSRC